MPSSVLIPLILEARAEFKKIFHSFFWFKWEQENLFRGHTFKKLAHFPDFWPLSPSSQFFTTTSCFQIWPIFDPSPLKNANILNLKINQSPLRLDADLNVCYKMLMTLANVLHGIFPTLKPVKWKFVTCLAGWRTFQHRAFHSTPYFSIVNSSTPDFLTPDFSTPDFLFPDFSSPDFSTTRGWEVWGWILGLKNPGLKWLANQKSALVEEYTYS